MATETDTWCRHCGDDIERWAKVWVAHWSTGAYLKDGDHGRCPVSRDGLHHPANAEENSNA